MPACDRSETDPEGTSVFADMAGFTALTEAHGDEHALTAAFLGERVADPQRWT